MVLRKKGPSVAPGQVIGAWTVLFLSTERGRKWMCLCKCGERGKVSENTLLYKKSSGCRLCVNKLLSEQKLVHGHSRHALYPRWKLIINSCYDKKCKRYKYYGAKGIRVCDRWKVGEDTRTGFECFLKDMGFQPNKKLTRKDNTKDFDKENLIWVD